MFPFERFSICLFTTASFQLSKRRNSPITLVYNTSFVILCCLYCVNITMYLSTLFSRSSNFYRTFIIIVFRFSEKFYQVRSVYSRNTTLCEQSFHERMSLAQLHLQGYSSLIIRQLLAGILDERVPTVTEELPRISFINDKTINPLPSLNYECKCVFARRWSTFASQHASPAISYMKIFYILVRNVRVIRFYIFITLNTTWNRELREMVLSNE